MKKIYKIVNLAEYKLRYIINFDTQDIIFQNIESKHINGYQSYYNNDDKLIFPFRVLGSNWLAGNKRLYEQSKQKVCDEMKENKKIYDKVKLKKKEYKKIMETGKQKWKKSDINHFNIETEELNYNPLSNNFGFKYGPLRYIQTAAQVEAIEEFKKNKEFNLSQSPANTLDLLNFINNHSNCHTITELNDVFDSYKYFLWLQHSLEYLYQVNNIQGLSFDKKEFKERVKSLSSIFN